MCIGDRSAVRFLTIDCDGNARCWPSFSRICVSLQQMWFDAITSMRGKREIEVFIIIYSLDTVQRKVPCPRCINKRERETDALRLFIGLFSDGTKIITDVFGIIQNRVAIPPRYEVSVLELHDGRDPEYTQLNEVLTVWLLHINIKISTCACPCFASTLLLKD